ncbi:MAG: hypothetical protein AAFV93_01945 [Chloroflexota bacterium]
MVLVHPRQIALQDWYGDLQVFGDIRQVDSINAIVEYYYMNHKQRSSLEWLYKNHLPYLQKYYGVDPAKCKTLLTVSRLGFNKSSQQLFVCLVCARVVSSDLNVKFLETRHVALGKNGGRKLFNTKYNQAVNGERVLIEEVHYSELSRII